jgi:sortase A
MRMLSRATLRRSEYLFLIIGFLCLGYVGFAMMRASVYQSYESYRLVESFGGRNGTPAGYLRSFWQPVEPPPAISIRQAGPKLVLDPGLIGLVQIPRLDISVVVREGVDDKTLGRAVGHVSTTPLPGSPGNVGIAAHRDTYFRNVRNIRNGDTIRMVTPKGTYEYVVDSLKIVDPKEVSVLDPTPQPAITLVTCYPFNFIGSAPKRFIVRALQVSTPVSTEARVGAPKSSRPLSY